MEEEQKLRVTMLGSFSMRCQGRLITFERNSSAKFIQLLQLILLNMKQGISKAALVDALYGQEEIENRNATLNNTIFRLRRQLALAGLPKDTYLEVRSGMCRWNGHIPVEVDIHLFEQLADQAERARDQEERIRYLEHACKLYKGEFLPMMQGEEWAIIANTHFEQRYTYCLEQLCGILKARMDYDKIIRLCSAAVQIYPFKEWQLWIIDSYIAMNRYREAMGVYQRMERMYFEELGLSPTKRMLERFQVMSSHISQNMGAISDIKRSLQEEEERDGAYYCSLPSFIDIYRIISRMMERNGVSVFLMLATLTDSMGRPLEQSERTQEIVDKFRQAVQVSLRKGDLFTRYSFCQFLVMLPGTNQENCGVISSRLDKRFKEIGAGRNKVSYYVASIAELREWEGGDEAVRFRVPPWDQDGRA